MGLNFQGRYLVHESKYDEGLGAVIIWEDAAHNLWVAAQGDPQNGSALMLWQETAGRLVLTDFINGGGAQTQPLIAKARDGGFWQVSSAGDLIRYSAQDGRFISQLIAQSPFAGFASNIAQVKQVKDNMLLISVEGAHNAFYFYDLATKNLQKTALTDVSARSFDYAQTENGEWIVAASMQGDAVKAIKVFADGDVLHSDMVGAADGIGMAGVSAIEHVTAYGKNFVIVADAITSSVNIFELTKNGYLSPLDQITDTAATRFGAIQAVETFAHNDWQYVALTGDDGGVSVFTILPDGRFLHRESFSATAEQRIGAASYVDVNTNETNAMIVLRDEDRAGFASLSFDLDGPDSSLIFDQTNGAILRGDSGDNILVGPDGHADYYGGAGADVFVFKKGATAQTIHDFEKAEDKLDLSDFAQLYSPDQLRITPTDTGAQISFKTFDLTVQSATLDPLNAADFFDYSFDWASTYDLEIVRQPRSQMQQYESEIGNAQFAGATFNIVGDAHNTSAITADAQGRINAAELPDGVYDMVINPKFATGNISKEDAQIALDLMMNNMPEWGLPAPQTYLAADMNMDGVLDTSDVLMILNQLGQDATTQMRFTNPYYDGASSQALNDDALLTVEAVIQDGQMSFAYVPVYLGDLDGWF